MGKRAAPDVPLEGRVVREDLRKADAEDAAQRNSQLLRQLGDSELIEFC